MFKIAILMLHGNPSPDLGIRLHCRELTLLLVFERPDRLLCACACACACACFARPCERFRFMIPFPYHTSATPPSRDSRGRPFGKRIDWYLVQGKTYSMLCKADMRMYLHVGATSAGIIGSRIDLPGSPSKCRCRSCLASCPSSSRVLALPRWSQ